MSWSDNDRHEFIRQMLTLGTISKTAMMEATYQVLVSDYERILDNGVDMARVNQALDQMIVWFSEKERYEYCAKLKQIKECLESK